MKDKTSEAHDKIRQQFDDVIYPRISIETSPKNIPASLYIHNLVTPYYIRNKQVIDTEGKLILDAGCGSGYTSLILAEANPGARIIGVDISPKSIECSQERFKYHGIENFEFHVLSIEDLPQLGLEFDYINCDEVLYLLPDPVSGLQILKSVLKPEGIIRGNFHSSLQRTNYFRAQETFKMMGLMDRNPGEFEIGIVREIMDALKDGTILKAQTWKPEKTHDEQHYFMNYFLMEDKGFTIPEVFSLFQDAELQFISMVNWWQWNLMDLFKESDNLPAFLGMSLPDISPEEHLKLFELLHPVHRLLDFWFGHSRQGTTSVTIDGWDDLNWQQAIINLHPQLATAAVEEDMRNSIAQIRPFLINQHLPITGESCFLDSKITACLLLLLKSAQPMEALVARYQKLYPTNPLTLEIVTKEKAEKILRQALTQLEREGYLLIESEISTRSDIKD